MSNLKNRSFTKEDKKLRPKVYIQKEDPTDSDNSLFFKIDKEEVSEEGEVFNSGQIIYNKDGEKINLYPKTSYDNIIFKDGVSLEEKLEKLTNTVLYDVLLKANWVVGTDIPYSIKLDYTIPKENDIFIIINTDNQDIIEQCAQANIISGEHLDTYIVINAFGSRPKCDIPIKLVVVERDPQEPDEYILEQASDENLGGIISSDDVEIDEYGSMSLKDVKDSLNQLNDISI